MFTYLKWLNMHFYTVYHHHHHHHHHQVMLIAQILLDLSCHLYLPSISLGRSSRHYPVFAQSWPLSVFVVRPTLIGLCQRAHRWTLLISSSVHLQQCPPCLARLARAVCEIGREFPYDRNYAEWSFKYLFKTVFRFILLAVKLTSIWNKPSNVDMLKN